MAKKIEHLSDFVFVSMLNLNLARQDLYLSYLKLRIKPDTFVALRTAPRHMARFSLDHVLKKAEEDNASFDSK